MKSVLLVKNSKWSKDLLYSMWKNGGDFLNKPFHEQSILGKYYNENILNSRSHIKILPSNDINNNDPNNKFSFICHMMAKSMNYRIRYANRKLKTL